MICIKRYSYILIMLIFIFFITIGCQNKEKNIEQPQLEDKVESRLIEAVESGSIDTVGMTKLREFSTDLDLDSIEETIELYTAAGSDEKGQMLWDDGQNWVLAVRDGERSYPLLSQYVQLGQVYFTVSNSGEDKLRNITVIVPAGASFSIKGYSFDKEKDGFKEELIYKAKDDSWIYSSIPGY